MAGRPSVMTEEIIANKKRCILCGYDRILDRAHLIPRRISRGLIGVQRMTLFTKRSVILLCKNCHFLFDHNRLNEEEWKIMRPILARVNEEILLIANSNLKPMTKRAMKDTPAKDRLIKKWINSLVPNYLMQNAR